MASGGGESAAEASVNFPQKIQRLDEAVVNRIAAGEVVQRPANAIKEMIENCLDAGASSIQVTVKEGGLKLIQIQDNGCGIRKEDMTIVCERFTTSKLRKFEDLTSIRTYGFRGEALASISHVAHVTITTRTADSKCAYKGSYSDGKLLSSRPGGLAEPRPCAGNRGTLISAEDLFYSIPTRRRALRASEEYSRIGDVITKYAIHNAGVAFTLKKQGQAVSDVRTLQSSSVTENISTLYGASVGRELLEVSCDNSRLGFKMSGHVTNANYSVKKLQFILFINHRLVDSASIRKAIECVYAAYLPKNTHPFVYLSIDIIPANVDVNVHPTKHEVHFLHEDMVVESVQKAVEDGLLNCNVSRTFYTQSLLPTPVTLNLGGGGEEKGKKGPDKPSYAYQMVRTDSKEQKLDAFVVPRSLQLSAVEPAATTTSPSHSTAVASEKDVLEEEGDGEIMSEDRREVDVEGGMVDESVGGKGGEECMEEDMEGVGETERAPMEMRDDSSAGRSSYEGAVKANPVELSSKCSSKPQASHSGVDLVQSFSRSRKSRRREVNLTSVLDIQHSVRSQQHRDLAELFLNHKFVGCVDQIRALIQHQTKLYLVDISRITKELFYQLVLFDFANFGLLKLTPPAPIHDLVMLALNLPESEWTPEYGPKEKISQHVRDLMKEKAEMLKDYFSIDIREDGLIYSLPMLLGSYSPNLDRLPLFLLRLATEVNWEEEGECFRTVATELGWFYGIQHDPFLLDSSEEEQRTEEEEGEDGGRGREDGGNGDEREPKDSSLYKKRPWRWTVEHVVFPALRTEFVPQKKMATDGSLLQIADLHDLYKVFERC